MIITLITRNNERNLQNNLVTIAEIKFEDKLKRRKSCLKTVQFM